MEAATVRRTRKVSGIIAARYNVQELFIIFVDHQNQKAKAMHFQEAEKAWFVSGESMTDRIAKLEPTHTVLDGTTDSKFTHVMWDDAIEVWTPTHTYTCTRTGITNSESLTQ